MQNTQILRRWPIRVKLLVFYTFLFVLTLSLSSLMMYSFVRQHIEANIRGELRNTTASLVNMIRATVNASILNHLRGIADKNREIVSAIYQQYREGRMTEAEAREMASFTLLSQTIGKTGYIYCLNSQGVLAIHPKTDLTGTDISAYQFVKTQIQRQEGYLEYSWQNPDESQARPKALYMTYFEPWDWIISVSSYREEFSSLINIHDFRELILNIRFGQTGYPYMIDSRGKLILHPKLEGHNIIDAQDASGRDFIREICLTKRGQIIYPWQNPDEPAPREKLVVFDHIPEFDWIVVSSSYLEEFYHPLIQVRNIMMITVLITILLAIPVTLFISTSITRPLRELREQLSVASDGDFSGRMSLTTSDEIGEVAQYFNKFMGQLESYQDNLRAQIQERKLAEELLLESERKFSNIISFLPDPTMVIDRDGKVVAWNRAIEELTGVKAADIVGQGDYVYALPFYGERRRILIDLVLLPDEQLEEKYANVRRDGNILFGESYTPRLGDDQGLYLSATAAALRDSKGQVIGAIETIRDMTDRRRIEEARRLSEDRYHSLMEAAPDPIVIYDLQGQVEYLNPAFTAVFGWALAELKGCRIDFVPPENLPETIDAVQRMFRGETIRALETRRLTKDGRILNIQASSAIFHDQDQKPLGSIVILRDVTDRRRIEDDLKLSEERYRSLMDSTPNPVVVYDLQGLVVYLNPEFTRVFGWTLDELRGRRTDFIPPENVAETHAAVEKTLRSGEIQNLITRRLTKDRRILNIQISASTFRDRQNKIKGMVVTLRDITAQWKLEQRLKERTIELAAARDAAEAANQAKSAFLATMSHEIRTPMNGIIGMTGLLLDTQLSPEQRNFAENVRSSSEALLTIINDILDFSKIEAGQLELEQAPFNLRECVESALDMVAVKAGEKGLEIACLLDQDLPAAITGDQTRLRQILLNLLSNAIKFTPQGEIIVTVSSAPLIAQQSDQNKINLTFSVRDTGIGIPANRMDRLFKSFSQVDSSTTRKYGGTGLGLAISKRLTELMGGQISVESLEGQGATFSFNIIVPAAEIVLPQYLNTDQPTLAGRQVLIVDDNAINREILLRQTLSWGMRPETAASGLEALETITSEPRYDIALLDFQLPGMDGVALAQKIHQTTMASDLPLVMMSSMGMTENKSCQTEFKAWLSKPVKASQLYNTLLEVLGGGGSVHPQTDDTSEYDPQLAERLPLKILLAEDNPINQQLALLTLGRFGYRADLAGNGSEVLDALRRQTYDVILMDIQMPEMDGLEATKRIRREFQPEKQPRIIAMTANAMQGDREMCLAAGMNDYISKPFRVKELIRVLTNTESGTVKAEGETLPAEERAQTRPPAANPRPEAAPPPASPETIDDAALKRLQALLGKKADALLPKLLHDFFVEAGRLQAQARQAMTQNDSESLRRAMHTLKANARSFGALTLGDLCQEAETIAKSGSTDTMTWLDQIANEFQRAQIALNRRLNPAPPQET